MDKGHPKEGRGGCDGPATRTPSGPGGAEKDLGRWKGLGIKDSVHEDGLTFPALVQTFSRLHRARGDAQAELAEREERLAALARHNSDLKHVLKRGVDSLGYCKKLAKCKLSIHPPCVAGSRYRQFLVVLVAASAAALIMLGGVPHENQQASLSLEERASEIFAGEARLAGESSLNVCSRNVGPQWMNKDGEFLCPLGSLWLDHNDARFFGGDGACVPKRQWDSCRSPLWGWPSFRAMHNLCWDMVFAGATKDKATGIISFSPEATCFATIRRRSSLLPCSMAGANGARVVRTGVSAADAEAARARLHVSGVPKGGHAFPAAVERLLGARVSWAPLAEAPAPGDAMQAVSQYSVVVVDRAGAEHEMASWLHWDGAAVPAQAERAA